MPRQPREQKPRHHYMVMIVRQAVGGRIETELRFEGWVESQAHRAFFSASRTAYNDPSVLEITVWRDVEIMMRVKPDRR